MIKSTRMIVGYFLNNRKYFYNKYLRLRKKESAIRNQVISEGAQNLPCSPRTPYDTG